MRKRMTRGGNSVKKKNDRVRKFKATVLGRERRELQNVQRDGLRLVGKGRGCNGGCLT